MQIGVAGLGAMGAAVAARLVELGHQVTVWNRSPGANIGRAVGPMLGYATWWRR